jgi:hypothetical protein
VLDGVGRQLLLVGSPAHLGGGGALLAEALHAPGVHELVDLLGHVGDLGVALAAVNDLHPQLPGQLVPGLVLHELLDLLGVAPLGLAVLLHLLADVEEPLLREVRDQAGVGAVLDHRRGALLLPAGHHPTEVHVAPVEGALGGVLVLRSLVGVPDLDRGVHVEYAVVVAPLEDLAGVDVPGQVDDHVTGADVLLQNRRHVRAGDLLLHERDALLRPGGEHLPPVLEVHHRDVLRRHLHVLHEDGQRALRHRAVTDEQDPLSELDHVDVTSAGSDSKARILSMRAGGL